MQHAKSLAGENPNFLAVKNAKFLAGAGPILRDLIDQFGARAVLVSYLREVMARRKMPNAGALPDYLRADIGLPPRPPDMRHWERYR